MKKYLIILVSILFLTFPGIVNAATLNKESLELEVGNNYNLQITEGYTLNNTVEWISNSTDVATVTPGADGKATVNAVGSGVATITATIKTGDNVDATLTCNVTVSAAATTTKYTVTFNTNGGSTIASQEVTENSKATKPKDPTKNKYRFVDWYSDENLTNLFNFDNTISSNITLYAKWEEVPSADVTLSNIVITGGKLKETFNKDKTDYTLELDEATINDFSKFKLEVVESDSSNVNTVISSTESYNNIKGGITILVRDKYDTDNSKKYTIKLEEKELDLTLKSLGLTGYKFTEAFESVKTIYSVSIPNNVTSVTIDAQPTDSTSKVAINARGASAKGYIVSDLPEGTTTINVVVTNGGQSKTYYINVTRAKENGTEEESTEEQSEEITKEDIKTSKNDKKNNTSLDAKDPIADTMFNKVVVSTGCIILFAIGILGIYFYAKTSPKKMKKEVLNKKVKKDASPIVEVQPTKKVEMLDPLEETKEYKR